LWNSCRSRDGNYRYDDACARMYNTVCTHVHSMSALSTGYRLKPQPRAHTTSAGGSSTSVSEAPMAALVPSSLHRECDSSEVAIRGRTRFGGFFASAHWTCQNGGNVGTSPCDTPEMANAWADGAHSLRICCAKSNPFPRCRSCVPHISHGPAAVGFAALACRHT
jgi:hypothetical protein